MKTFIACVSLVVFLLSPLVAQASDAKKPVTIEDVVKGGPQRSSYVWSPDSKQFAFSEGGKLYICSAATGKRREVLTWKTIQDAAATPSNPTVFDWTNRRVSAQTEQWFSDGRRMLISANGDLFSLDLPSGRFNALTHTEEAEQDPKLSPDNTKVSFRRNHDLFVMDLQTRTVTQLTHDGSATLLNAELDWVYPEELDLGTAHWWAPDSRSIAYLQLDIAQEPIFPQVSLLAARGQLEPERYPKPGDPNATVRVGVVSVAGGAPVFMQGTGDLVARVNWMPDCTHLAIQHLNRTQNRLTLLSADARTGGSHTLLEERDRFWVNVNDGAHFLKDGSGFLWSSEQDGGFRHLFLYSFDGKLHSRLTKGEWEVTRLAAVDEAARRVIFVSSEQSPLERQVYSVDFDGKNKQRLSTGEGTHTVSAAPDGSAYLDTYSSLSNPPETTLRDRHGAQVAVLRSADQKRFAQFDLLPTEIKDFRTADGTRFFARLIKPAGFDPRKKYPAICMVYGGPHLQTVTDQWAGITWDQALAQKGFVVWQMDNRGSGGRGHSWESQIYHNLGALELEDQKAGIRYLTSLGFVDANRLGLFGWSYGGYMTLYSLTHAPDLFRAGVAGAPVTDWHNYDTIYTERYMGLPAENEDGYRKSSPVNSAASLKAKLMLVHNFEDDNVHFQNTLQMADALERANRKFQMLIYPQRSHGVTGGVRQHMLESVTEFFEQNLGI